MCISDLMFGITMVGLSIDYTKPFLDSISKSAKPAALLAPSGYHKRIFALKSPIILIDFDLKESILATD